MQAHRANDHFKRRDGSWPDNALAVVVLFDGCGRDAADAYAIAAHLQHGGLAVVFQEGRVQRFGVLVAQEKDVAYFDAALYGQFAALRVGVASHHIAQVGNLRFWQVAAPVDAGVVKAFGVGAANEIAHVGDSRVGDNGNGLQGLTGPR